MWVLFFYMNKAPYICTIINDRYDKIRTIRK